MKLLRLGVTYGFGAELRRTLAASTSNRVSAFFSGMAITALLQSSTATVLIVSTFASQGMIKAATGLAMVLGADVGTTLVAQVFSLDLTILVSLFMVGGYVLFSLKANGRLKNLGRIFVGLALMLFSLGWIREATEPLKESLVLEDIIGALGSDPFFAVILVAILTWLVHSSLAIVLLLMSFVVSGILPVTLGLYMVLGANLGGTIPPILATLKDNPEALRIPVGNLIVRLIGVSAVFSFIPLIEGYVNAFDATPAREIVNFHTAFNIFLALLFLPLTGIISGLCAKMIPDHVENDDPAHTRYLDEKDLSMPSVALAAATRETLRMADLVQEMLDNTIRVFKTNDMMLLEDVREEDDTIDKIYEQIKTYMAKLSQEFMSEKEAQRYVQVLTFSTNLEHAGDIIDKNLMPLALKKIKRQIDFSESGWKEIEHIHHLVMESVQLAQSIFVSDDVELAQKLLEEKHNMREVEIAGMAKHIERLGEGIPETIATSSLHVDIIRDYRRINSYMCTVAYPLLEEDEKRLKRFTPKEKTSSDI